MDWSQSNQRKILSFLDEVSHSELDVTQWLSSFESMFGYSQTVFWSCDQSLRISCIAARNIEKRAIEEYDQYYHKMDLLAPKLIFPIVRERKVLRLVDLLPHNAYEQNPYYNEYMAKYKHYHLMTMYLMRGSQILGLIDFIRPKKDPVFSDQEVMKMEILSRFLSQRLESYKPDLSWVGGAPQGPFTPKEKEVLDLVRKGKSNEEISARLHISINTVKTHLLNLYRKSGASNRTELCYKTAANLSEIP